MKRALIAELLKLKHAPIVWVTFIAFAIAPLMGALFMYLLNDPTNLEEGNALRMKTELMGFTTDWQSYLGLLTMAIAVGGVLIFGFVASWVFGREYADNTVKDLLAMPISRTKIVHAKFGIYFLWCVALAISNLILGLVIGWLMDLSAVSTVAWLPLFSHYFITALLTIIIGTPIAFFAIWSKGYLGPLGFVALALVLSQIIAATGFGSFFPWSIPGLYSGAGGDTKDQIDIASYSILIVTSIVGYLTTLYHWKYADQTA